MNTTIPLYLRIIFIAMLPVVELRGAIPVAIGYGFYPWAAFALSVLGNMLPVPFILLFIRPLFKWLSCLRLFRPLIERLEAKAWGKSERVARYRFWGLALFVAIPLPGTGAWTGALIASLLDMRFKQAMAAIFMGVLIAGVLVTLISSGVFAGVDFLKAVFFLK